MRIASISACKKHVGVVPQFRAGVLVLLALSFLVGVMPCAQGQQYKFQRLNPPGSTYSVAFGVNNNGVVVGSFVNASSEFEGFAYKSGKYEAIVFPGAVGFTQASGINDSNTGYVATPLSRTQAR